MLYCSLSFLVDHLCISWKWVLPCTWKHSVNWCFFFFLLFCCNVLLVYLVLFYFILSYLVYLFSYVCVICVLYVWKKHKRRRKQVTETIVGFFYLVWCFLFSAEAGSYIKRLLRFEKAQLVWIIGVIMSKIYSQNTELKLWLKVCSHNVCY